MKPVLPFILFLQLFNIGCSNKAVYENIQRNRMNNCIKLPPPRDEQCKKTYQKTYREYKQQREKALKK